MIKIFSLFLYTLLLDYVFLNPQANTTSSTITMANTYKKLEAYEEFSEKYSDSLKKLIEISTDTQMMIDKMKRFMTNEQNIQLVQLTKNELKSIQKKSISLQNEFQKKNFDISIMGAEKAGKSSLINALIGENLLPNSAKRCTQTTIEIRSSSGEQNRISIEYFSRKEFDDYKNSIKERIVEISDDLKTENSTYSQLNETKFSSEQENLSKELEEIELAEKNSKDYIGRSAISQVFTVSSEIANILKENGASVHVARTVKKIIIYTNKIDFKNATLYDVPGFNSPNIIHKELTKKRALKSDIIIFAKLFQQPSLTETDLEMLKIFDESSEYIPLKEKLIVALTQPNLAMSRKEFDNNMNTITQIWTQKGVDFQNIMHVDAYDFTDRDKDAKELIKSNLEKMNLPNGDGIKKFKNAIKDSISNSRMKNLKNKYEAIKNHFISHQDRFIDISKQEFNFEKNLTQEEIDASIKEKKIGLQMAWWAQEEISIKNEFTEFLNKEIYEKNDPDDSPKYNKFLPAFREKYLELVDRMLNETKMAKEDEQRKVFTEKGRANEGVYTVPSEGHAAIRISLSEEVYRNLNNLVLEKVSDMIWETILKIVDWLYVRMWSIDRIKQHILQDEVINSKLLIQKQIETLVLRQSRPAIELFLRYSRHDGKKSRVERYKKEIIILDMFYQMPNETRILRGLPTYLLTGQFDTAPNYSSLDFDLSDFEVDRLKEKFAEIREEINNDFIEFINYMKYSIYYASGIVEFFGQEIDRICKLFEYEEKNYKQWSSIVFQAIEAGHQNIPFEKFALAASDKINVSNEIYKLNEKYKNFKTF